MISWVPSNQQQQQPLMYSCTYMKKLLQIRKLNEVLEYWLPGITTGASGARQPVDISIK